MALGFDQMACEFSGVVALVAGGANGLGVAIAKGLAKRGAQVYISGDLVENSKQILELSSVVRGLCVVLPKGLSTADELLAEVAEREDNINILIDDATAGWGPVFAHADSFFDMLLNGGVDASDPAHIIAVMSSAQATGLWDSKVASAENARALAAEYSDECVVVNCIEPARNEGDTRNVVDMAMSLCSQSSAKANGGISCVDDLAVSVPQKRDPFPFPQAKL
jgi:NAD(P)-dependent dehydrogenase (short-subunit alcohol dehydrogenase family)